MTVPSDGESFDVFERRRWGETAAAYDRAYTALTDQTLDLLLDRSGVSGSIDCLDLACGTGTLAARAVSRGARALGIDFAPEMIELARARHDGAKIDFRVGDAARLELPPACVDAVVMNFGMMHMALPDAVARSVGHVLRPGGRFCFTVWAQPEKSAASRIIGEAMALATVPVPLPAGEPFYRYCDADECRRLLGPAGFDVDSVVLEDVPLLWRFPDTDSLYELFATATTRSALVLEKQAESTRRVIREAFARGVSAWATSNGEYAVPHAAVLVMATRAN
jgi:SAM-dependent methyltransferase